jgi:hypothetical protein
MSQSEPTSQSVSESVGTATAYVQLSHPTIYDVTIPVSNWPGGAASNADYKVTKSQITIPAGQKQGFINVGITNDTQDEPSAEIVVLQIGAPTNAFRLIWTI